MDNKTKKVQSVIAAFDESSQSFFFLLLQTNKKRGEFWQNVTGKLEDQETFEEGALREAIEETQLQIEAIIDIVDLNLVYKFTDKWKRKVTEKCFLIILDKKWEVQIDDHEHQDHQWVKLDELTEGIVHYPSNYETLEKSRYLLKHWGR
jgi:8-oxo-dGTP pyrophosphatase MutT (NUDIX family)